MIRLALLSAVWLALIVAADEPKPPTNGRAWMVDPPGGLHDSAEDALMWACRYRHGAAVVWVTVTPRGKAEAARAAAPAQVRRG